MKAISAILPSCTLALFACICLFPLLATADDIYQNTDAEEISNFGEYVKRTISAKFKDMCKAYHNSAEGSTKITRQYAVMWIGEDNYASKAKGFDKIPIDTLIDKGDYYVAARYYNDQDLKEKAKDEPPAKKPRLDVEGVHTEVVILKEAEELIKKYSKENIGEKPKLYLYSWKSPCCGSPVTEECPNGCSGKIAQWVQNEKSNIDTLTIAWDNNYMAQGQATDPPFLYGLYRILEPGNVKIDWNDGGYCATKKKWLQKEIFECIQSAKVEDVCSDATKFKSDVAKLINRVIWQCGTRKVTKKSSNPKAGDESCWKRTVDKIITNTDEKTKKLKTELATCVKTKSKDYLQYLGPALDPLQPTTYSQSAEDVKGGSDALCF